jgi:hypothetical protein
MVPRTLSYSKNWSSFKGLRSLIRISLVSPPPPPMFSPCSTGQRNLVEKRRWWPKCVNARVHCIAFIEAAASKLNTRAML